MTLIAEPRRKKWSKGEYHSLLEWAGVDHLRYELIGGEIIQMPPQTNVHSYGLSLADYALRGVFKKGFVIKVQSPLDLSASSEPEPDLMVVKGNLRAVRKHPKKAELIVEIAWGSLEYDRATKASLYASKGLRDYWIVNLHDRVLEVHRRPAKDPRAVFGYSYADVTVLAAGDVVSPLAAPSAKIRVADLLP
jgi:Uma2 family endonuclease